MTPYQIEITDPAGIHFEGARHSLKFTRGHGTDVLHLTDADLDSLERAIAARRAYAVPRTAEEIIRAGDLGRCGTRVLNDLAREMGIPTTGRDAVPQGRLRQAMYAEAHRRGWM